MAQTFQLKGFLAEFFLARPYMVLGYVATMLVYPVGTVVVPSLAGVVLEKVKSRAALATWSHLLYLFLGLAVLLLAQYLIGVFLDARLNTEMQAYVRTEVFERVMAGNDRHFEVQDTSIILSRVLKLPVAMVNVVQQYRNMVIPGAFTLLGVLVYFFYLDYKNRTFCGPALLGIAGVLVGGLYLSAQTCGDRMVAADNTHDELHNHLGDTLDNLLHIYLSDASTEELARLHAAQDHQVSDMTTALQCPNYHVSALQTLLTLGLLGIGVHVVNMYYNDRITAVQLTSTLFVLMCSRHILFNALAAWPHLLWSTAMIVKLGTYINSLSPRDSAAAAAGGCRTSSRPTASLVFTNVTYQYAPGADPVLRNASMVIDGPQMVALVGGIGSGKSTIAKLALGLHSSYTGTIEVGGASVGRLTRQQLSERIMYVPANPPLLNLSVGENLRLGIPNCTDDAITNALARLGLDEMFADLSAPVGRGGTNLSTGQRVMLYLARVLLRDTKIILCDEVTANLDPEFKARVTDALADLAATKVVLLITHDRALLDELGVRTYRLEDQRIVAPPA